MLGATALEMHGSVAAAAASSLQVHLRSLKQSQSKLNAGTDRMWDHLRRMLNGIHADTVADEQPAAPSSCYRCGVCLCGESGEGGRQLHAARSRLLVAMKHTSPGDSAARLDLSRGQVVVRVMWIRGRAVLMRRRGRWRYTVYGLRPRYYKDGDNLLSPHVPALMEGHEPIDEEREPASGLDSEPVLKAACWGLTQVWSV